MADVAVDASQAGLVTFPGYFDVALRDLGLLLGALALARLATVYG